MREIGAMNLHLDFCSKKEHLTDVRLCSISFFGFICLQNRVIYRFFLFQSSYSYAISVFDGRRTYKSIKNLFTAQKVCSLIACTQMNVKKSCGLRTSPSQVHNRYTFENLSLQTAHPVKNHTKTMPNTLTGDLLPLNVTEFEYKM